MAGYSRNKDPRKQGDIGADFIELASTDSQQMIENEDNPFNPRTSFTYSASYEGPINPLDEQLPLWQAIRRYPKVVGYFLALTVAIIGWGYDLVIVGSITGVDSFKEDYGKEHEGELIIPSLWLTLWLALPPAGATTGSVLGGWMQDRIGRKFSLMVGSIISAIAVALIFFSYLATTQDSKRMMLTGGLTVQGLSVGIIKITTITYVSENAPTSLRGPAMALFPTFTLLGQLIGSIVVFLVNGVEGQKGYLSAFGSQWILALAPFILSCVMPDSPAFLVRKGKEGRAIRAATRLFAPKVNPHSALEKIRATIEEEEAAAANASYLTCFKGTNLRRTLIVILANCIPALFGLDLLSNGSYFLQTVGMASGPSLMLMIGGIVAGMIANAAGIWILSRVGRRTMTVVSMGVAGLLWGGMGISGFWTGQAAVWIAGGAMIAVIVVCGMGCWPASYAIMGETSSLQLRAPTQGLGGVAAEGASIVMVVALPSIFNPDAGDLGAKTGFVYSGLCAIGVAVTWFCLPEMKGRSNMEIDHMFEMRLPTRKFKSWKMEEHEVQAASPLVAGTE
ncbi:Fc.00g093610.m01.CDS01 [Cosmosporella sp. VM-42]